MGKEKINFYSNKIAKVLQILKKLFAGDYG